MPQPNLQLNGFKFAELFHADGLSRLDEAYLQALSKHKPLLLQQLLHYRQTNQMLDPLATSELLIAAAAFLETFLADLFHIQEALAISQLKTIEQNPISLFKKYYVLKRAKKELTKLNSFPPFVELQAWLMSELANNPLQSTDLELSVALLGNQYLADPKHYADEIEKLVQWSCHALSQTPSPVADWVSFRIPQRLDYQNLIPNIQHEHARLQMEPQNLRLRDGFQLTDPRMSLREVQDEVNYCIYCHDHDGDFCSKGFPHKKGEPALGFKKNPLDVLLTGCPLEEKISEAHYLKKDGHTIAALAMIMIDNPMCPATGHRICNDCMKACIYQKQEPVNIPQIETRILMDVLHLPWGVEIYDLLTRWNPLRQKQWVTKPYNGLKIMIAGMGPAGFTLAHHLLLEGFAIVGFDGLKIEPLPEQLLHNPIYRYADLQESLEQRLMAGFGGVAEYGITVRWDKNFLKLIYLSLMRRPYFQVFGSVRFGGTLTVEDAWEMGFHHFVIAVGAGLPKALAIPGSMSPGMRQANDFLMALQLGNAAKASSLTNLQIRLPAVIIGGGLTGVDAATEVQAYYLSQVEKVLHRYEVLIKHYGEDAILKQLDQPSQKILAEYLQHGLAVRNERARAKSKKEKPNFIKLIHVWGGVTIVYRRSMQESPAYINNCDELNKALQEGIYYLEAVEPAYVELDEYGHTQTFVGHQRVRQAEGEWITMTHEIKLPARTILVATGTQPNTAYEFEHRGTFNRLNLQYQHYEEDDHEQLQIAHGVLHNKDPLFGPFTSYDKHAKRVSLIGDTHPVFHGSVVKAIASGLRTYPKILDSLQDKLSQNGDPAEYAQFKTRMQNYFQAKIIAITRQTPHILELIIQAPSAAKHFKPGHFYRLQNFETSAPSIHDTLLQMEPLALVGAETDTAQGLIHFIVRENSVSAKLCATLKPGQTVSLMGPTGVRAKISNHAETILMIGNQAAFAFLRSYGKTARALGHKIIYVALMNHRAEVYCQSQLEDSADQIIWAIKDGELIQVTRSQDHTLQTHDLNQIFESYTNAHSDGGLVDTDRIFVMGDTDLLRQFQTTRKQLVKNYLLKDPKVVASVYGNMQCMLKGVCAQCLQWQIDPVTGLRTKAVFACSWQDQPLEIIDIDHIDARQNQNHVLEQLSSLWIDHLYKQDIVEKI